MLAEARKWLGTRGRPNGLTRAYASRNGSYFATAPWCDMAVTEWARRSGNYAAVCMGTDYAYTVWHAQAFQRAGRWHWGAHGARPGDIVFFDWGGVRSIGRIDHVGIVERNLGGGRLQTIEGNTGDACLRRVRSGSVITGYGRPAYGSGGASGGVEDVLVGLEKGDKGAAVGMVQVMCRKAGFGDVLGPYGPGKDGVDNHYGDSTARAVGLAAHYGGSQSDEPRDEINRWVAAQLIDAVARARAEQVLKQR